MSARQPRFEVVRVDGGYFVRFVAANGRIVWVTPGLYSKRIAAIRATAGIARAMSPTARIWIETHEPSIRFGHPSDSYGTAHRVRISVVDERHPDERGQS